MFFVTTPIRQVLLLMKSVKKSQLSQGAGSHPSSIDRSGEVISELALVPGVRIRRPRRHFQDARCLPGISDLRGCFRSLPALRRKRITFWNAFGGTRMPLFRGIHKNGLATAASGLFI